MLANPPADRTVSSRGISRVTARAFVSHLSPRGGTGQLGPGCLVWNYDVFFFLNCRFLFLLLSISSTELYREQSCICIFQLQLLYIPNSKDLPVSVSPEDEMKVVLPPYHALAGTAHCLLPVLFMSLNGCLSL